MRSPLTPRPIASARLKGKSELELCQSKSDIMDGTKRLASHRLHAKKRPRGTLLPNCPQGYGAENEAGLRGHRRMRRSREPWGRAASVAGQRGIGVPDIPVAGKRTQSRPAHSRLAQSHLA